MTLTRPLIRYNGGKWKLSEKIRLPACTGRPGKGYFSVEEETL